MSVVRAHAKERSEVIANYSTYVHVHPESGKEKERSILFESVEEKSSLSFLVL